MPTKITKLNIIYSELSYVNWIINSNYQDEFSMKFKHCKSRTRRYSLREAMLRKIMIEKYGTYKENY